VDVDIDLAAAGIDALIDRRAAAMSAEQRAAEAWAESALRHKAKIRERNRLAWQEYYLTLAGSLRASAKVYEGKAKRLNETEGANA
jgi:hypothetical protein